MEIPFPTSLLALMPVREKVHVLVAVAIELDLEEAVGEAADEEDAAVEEGVGDVVEMGLEARARQLFHRNH